MLKILFLLLRNAPLFRQKIVNVSNDDLLNDNVIVLVVASADKTRLIRNKPIVIIFLTKLPT